MKQQFFVGDVVEVVAVDSDNWYRVGEKFVVTGWNNGVYASPKDPDHITVGGADEGIWVEAKHVRILVRAWQKNTGVQHVNNDVEVLVKYADSTIDRAEACMFDWYAGDIGSIVEWRIADGLSSNVEQPEAIPPSHVALGEEIAAVDAILIEQEWTDKHYDNNYTLTQKDIERGFVKIDPYRVSKQWRLGSKDESGVLFHILKTVARFGEKNSREREVKALYAQIKCLAEIEGVNLDA